MPLNWYDGSTTYKEMLLLPGDTKPVEFTWNLKLTDTHLLQLYLRNDILQIACDWQVEEANRKWLTFNADKSVRGIKHGQPYTFKEFNDFLQWIEFKDEVESAEGWARLLGKSIMVHFDDQEAMDLGKSETTKGMNFTLGKSPTGRYLLARAFHPLCKTEEGANGYEILDEDVDQQTGKAKVYVLHVQTKGMTHEHVIRVDADRVVEFNWKKKQIKYGGDSRVRGLALMVLCEEQMFRRQMKRLHDHAGGIKFIPGVHTKPEKEQLEKDLGTDDISNIDTLYGGSGDDAPQWLVPDLKTTTEFDAAFGMFTTKYCRHLHMSQKVLDGESQGVTASAKYDLMSTYTEIFQIQERFRTALEKCFYKLGLDDTTFEYVPLLPEEMQDDFSIGISDKTPFGMKPEGKAPAPQPKEEKAPVQA